MSDIDTPHSAPATRRADDRLPGPREHRSTEAPDELDVPGISARFHPDRVDVDVDGRRRTFTASADASPREQALGYLFHLVATELGHPVRVHTYSNDDTYARLIVTPEGTYYDEGTPATSRSRAGAVAEARKPLDSPALVTDTEPHASLDHDGRALPDNQPPNRRAARTGRESFIREGRAVEPASQGWRGVMNRLGLRLAPGPGELAYRGDVAAVCRHWPGPRTIAIANGKGSANKTPTTVMLSAVFARYGGAGVLAWDNNETRGSLAWRTQQAGHDATVLDVLPRVDDLLSAHAHSAEMSHWTHHQPADRFDVLQSDQSVEGDHEVTGVDVERVHRVARRYYRLVLMDSGNNERAANWRAMMRRADALVIPCTNVEDTAEAGALLLEALASRDEHSEALADNAVAIVSQRTPGKDSNIDRIVKGLTPLVREVVTIPFDPALVSGVISFDALRPETQRAWLRAAAAVARGL